MRNVAAQNYFYRLNELSAEDMEFVRKAFIEQSPEQLRPGHEYLLQVFILPHQAKRRIEQSGNETPEYQKVLNEISTNANEKYHGSIEVAFKPLIDAMIAGDLSCSLENYLGSGSHLVKSVHEFATASAQAEIMRHARRAA